jgi:lipopolysaccharide transport system ATP-binding protein
MTSLPPAIQISHLSKRYRLGLAHAGSLQEVVAEATRRLFRRRRESSADARDESSPEYFWALNDLSLEVAQGDVIGIIGRNGAGKSTLLKVLSRITRPTSGRIEINGRVASLLEVGTGFHPELTGRENVFLNGAILGMTRAETRRKFSEIAEFAEIDRFLDTPVKHYSSGMYVRLAFAVAAHLQPEILIIDEVLAVGDAQFQKKCLGKLRDSSESGRTVLFVSHQMGSVLQLCTQAVCLENGRIAYQGAPQGAVDHYLGTTDGDGSGMFKASSVSEKKDLWIDYADCRDAAGKVRGRLNHNEPFRITIGCRVSRMLPNTEIRLAVKDASARTVFISDALLDFTRLNDSGTLEAVAGIPASFLRPGRYVFGFALHVPNVTALDTIHDGFGIVITDGGSRYAATEGIDYGCVFGPCQWSFNP